LETLISDESPEYSRTSPPVILVVEATDASHGLSLLIFSSTNARMSPFAVIVPLVWTRRLALLEIIPVVLCVKPYDVRTWILEVVNLICESFHMSNPALSSK
jgi:hypothetical protein